jgi:hypothetical protein
MGWTANSRKADRPMLAVKTGSAIEAGRRSVGVTPAERSSNDFKGGMVNATKEERTAAS